MAWHRQLPAGRPAPFRSSAAAGSTAQAVSRLGSAGLAWHRQAVRSGARHRLVLLHCVATTCGAEKGSRGGTQQPGWGRWKHIRRLYDVRWHQRQCRGRHGGEHVTKSITWIAPRGYSGFSTPKELSKTPKELLGTPKSSSLSGAENTEELLTPDGLPSRIAIDCLFKKLFRDNQGATIVLPDSSSEVSDSPVAIRGPASAGRRSSSRTFWGVLRACKARSRLRQRRKMAWHRQLPAGRPAPFRWSAAAGSTAQAVSRLGSAGLAWHRQAVRSERDTDLYCCIASPPRAAQRRAAVGVLSSRAGADGRIYSACIDVRWHQRQCRGRHGIFRPRVARS
eukprot:scaffold16609_cov92-Isochrysis_galbana.AAC.4